MNDLLRIVAHACIHEPGRMGPIVVIQGELDDVFRATRLYLQATAADLGLSTQVSLLAGAPGTNEKATLVGARERAVVRSGRFEGKVMP